MIDKIYEGWRNHLIPPDKLKELIKRISDERLAICKNCPHNSKYHKTLRPDKHCTICGCTLVAKAKCLSCDCPLGEPKWKAVMTEEQEDEIQQ